MTDRFSVPELREFANTVLKAAGLPAEPARVVADGLLEADLYGHTTHGLALLPEYVEELDAGTMTRTGRPEVKHQLGAVASWDGRRLPGIWTTSLAIEQSTRNAGELGIGAIAIAHSHHIGCLAAFLEQPAREGFAVLVLSSDPSDRLVAPHGSVTPVLTPNPIAVGIPAAPDPILIDISTSITTAGLCARARKEQKRLPGDWLVSQTGEPTSDPNALAEGGALLPVGGLDHGHKGFALGLMVEALTQGLSGFGRIDAPTEWGAAVLVLAFAPPAFGDSARFLEQVTGVATAAREATPNPNRPGGVRLPGERALSRKREAIANGVELYAAIPSSLHALAERFSLVAPSPIGT